MKAQRVPGLALAITAGDQVVYLMGYGKGGEGRPVTPDSQFMIASLSKSFTALAVMQLVEAGKVDLDAPVQTYLPEFTLADAQAAAQITVRGLLNHTSGLGDASYPAMRRRQPATPAQRVESLGSARPIAPPGTEFNYYDVNYQVLARVVEVASGQGFSDYLQEHIFAPLGMSRSFSALTSTEAVERAESLAKGHLNFFGIMVPAAEEKGYFGGSGGVISTAADMAHYLIMQANGGRYEGQKLLSPAGIDTMHTPPANIDSHYGMGWTATTVDGVRVLEHNGILSTYYADMAVLPESGYGIALLYDIQSVAQASLGFPQIINGLIDLVSGKQPASGGFSVSALEAVFAILTAGSAALGIRSLLRLPRWAEWRRTAPAWKVMPGIVWAFVPGALFVAMPSIVLSTSGRAFGFSTMVRAMPEVMSWLGISGVIGAIRGVMRILLLAGWQGNG